MLIIMKLAQEDVILAAEACAVVANVGPTSPAGWTALWSLDASAVASSLVGVRHLLVEEAPDGPRLSLAAANGTHILEGFWDPQGQGSGQVVVMASSLSELFQATDRQGELEELLREEPSDADQLIERLALALELPELIEPEPTRAAVAFRGDPAIARFAAALVGPAYLQSGSEGWSVLSGFGQDLKTPEVRHSYQLAAGLSGAARRSDSVLFIWRGTTASGLQLWRRGKVVSEWSWNSTWHSVAPQWATLEAQSEFVRNLVDAVGPAIDENLLRALIRRDWTSQDPLAELSFQFHFPAAILRALDDPARFRVNADVTFVQRISFRKAVFRAWRDGLARPATGARRYVQAGLAIVTVVAAMVCLLMTGLMAATLITEGAVIDEPTAGGEIWVALVGFTALTVLVSALAVARIRRLRQRSS